MTSTAGTASTGTEDFTAVLKLPASPASVLDCWDECLAAWTHFMASIKAFAETGTGFPFGA